MNRIFAVVVTLFLIASSSQGKEPPGLSDEAVKAYNTVRDSETFCDTAVGFAGKTPEVVSAFRILIKQPNPERILRKLIEDATVSGQSYALCGFYHSDYKFFKKVVEPYKKSQKTVKTQMGCVGSIDTVASIVESSSPDAVRLKNRSQTTKQ